jgi:hypothetical protein
VHDVEGIYPREYRLAAYRLAHERLREALTLDADPVGAVRSATDALIIAAYHLSWREWDELSETLYEVAAARTEAGGSGTG